VWLFEVAALGILAPVMKGMTLEDVVECLDSLTIDLASLIFKSLEL